MLTFTKPYPSYLHTEMANLLIVTVTQQRVFFFFFKLLFAHKLFTSKGIPNKGGNITIGLTHAVCHLAATKPYCPIQHNAETSLELLTLPKLYAKPLLEKAIIMSLASLGTNKTRKVATEQPDRASIETNKREIH